MQTKLSEIIRDKILKHGPMSFHDFMEMALYYPELGYYTSAPDKIGIEGDYYTTPYFTSIYGRLVAKQLEEMWQISGKNDFTVVEYGAGPGTLCADILQQLKSNEEFYDKLQYCIIEKSGIMCRKEEEIFDASDIRDGKLKWYDSISEIPSFSGCVLANEVVDNFSVHKVVMKESGLMEVFVDYDKGFIEMLKPAQENLKEYFARLNVKLPVGFHAEVNLEAIEWLKEISASLKKGFVLTIDYGYSSSELYCPRRRQGTLVCYNKHTVNDLPYFDIGRQDITAHVNFSALNLWGARHGLINCGFTNQSQFLLALGLTEQFRRAEGNVKNNKSIKKQLILLHTLMLSLGKKLKVLVQQKGLHQPLLSGLQFSEPLV